MPGTPNRLDCLANEPRRTACLLPGSRVTMQVLRLARQGWFQLLYLLTVRSSSCGSCLQGSEDLSWSKGLPPCLFVFVPFLPGWPGEGRGPTGGLLPTVARLSSPRTAPASHMQAGRQAGKHNTKGFLAQPCAWCPLLGLMMDVKKHGNLRELG